MVKSSKIADLWPLKDFGSVVGVGVGVEFWHSWGLEQFRLELALKLGLELVSKLGIVGVLDLGLGRSGTEGNKLYRYHLKNNGFCPWERWGLLLGRKQHRLLPFCSSLIGQYFQYQTFVF